MSVIEVEKLPDHVSFSQIRMWLRCQRQWYYRYVEGLKVPPPGAAVVGSATHRAIEHTNVELRDREKLPPEDEVLDVYADEFKELARDAIWGEEDPAEAKDRGAAGLRQYYRQEAATFRPEGIEERLEIPLRGIGVPFLGFVDLRTADGIVVDYKTTARRVNTLPYDVQLQIWLYQYVYGLSHIDVRKGEAVYIVAHKTKPAVIRHPVTPAVASDVARWLRIAEDVRLAMEQAVESGRFLPAIPGEWWCSPERCGYWDRCQRDF